MGDNGILTESSGGSNERLSGARGKIGEAIDAVADALD